MRTIGIPEVAACDCGALTSLRLGGKPKCANCLGKIKSAIKGRVRVALKAL